MSWTEDEAINEAIASRDVSLTCQWLHTIVKQAVQQAVGQGELELPDESRIHEGQIPQFWVRRAPPGYGEFASNIVLVLAAVTRTAPWNIAKILQARIAENLRPDLRLAIEEAKGFLNFHLDEKELNEQMARALREGARYGMGSSLAGVRTNVEFVSADPTGPLPFSFGRNAAMGEALCRVLEFQGADVTREFYLNDVETSSKMRLLGESVAAFYLSTFEHNTEWPEGALQDNFVRGVAEAVVQRDGNKYLLVPESERAAAFAQQAREAAVALQKRALQEFGVRFDVWTSENALNREGRISGTINRLKERGYTYERDGALWLRTTAFGDVADRPLVRSNGETTYLTSDIAYHVFKMERGFDLVLNIWTAQHQPYVQRTHAALQASGCAVDKLEVLLCEGARLLRDGTPVAGKGGGTLTLEEAVREVDCDTLRFSFLQYNWEDLVEIEIETACRDDETNPAYAARLVPSRLATMIRELETANGLQGTSGGSGHTMAGEEIITWSTEERELLRLVALWPDEAQTAATRREPQRIAQFVTEMAVAVRRLLSASRPATPDAETSNADAAQPAARLQLLRAAQVTASNALWLLGIEASEKF